MIFTVALPPSLRTSWGVWCTINCGGATRFDAEGWWRDDKSLKKEPMDWWRVWVPEPEVDPLPVAKSFAKGIGEKALYYEIDGRPSVEVL